jgi:acyl carrier protein
MTDNAARLARVIREQLAVDDAAITPEADFADDLRADSLDMVELTTAVEEEFGVEITDDEAERIVSVADALTLVEGKLGGVPVHG